LTFVTDIVGITPAVEGLKIESCLPSDMTYAGVSEYNYGNRIYQIEVNKSLTTPVITFDGEKYTVKLPANKTYYITLQNKLIEA
jgi:cellobiose phosphorylase